MMSWSREISENSTLLFIFYLVSVRISRWDYKFIRNIAQKTLWIVFENRWFCLCWYVQYQDWLMVANPYQIKEKMSWIHGFSLNICSFQMIAKDWLNECSNKSLCTFHPIQIQNILLPTLLNNCSIDCKYWR